MLSSSDRWNQLETLFHKSLELEPDARSAFLDDSCGEDTELRKELDALLDEVDKPTDILKQPCGSPKLRMSSLGFVPSTLKTIGNWPEGVASHCFLRRATRI